MPFPEVLPLANSSTFEASRHLPRDKRMPVNEVTATVTPLIQPQFLYSPGSNDQS